MHSDCNTVIDWKQPLKFNFFSLKNFKRRTVCTLLICASVPLAACASTGNTDMKPLESNIQVDLNRYMGKWWVIANIPYFAEKGKVATADEYKLLADGKIDNIYHYRKSFNKSEKSIQATAEVVPNTGNAKWEIGFLWGIIKADYLILEVAPDYSWALIGHPKRNLAWIFSREKVMDENLYVTLREKFRNFGYNPDLILRIPQFKEQIDKPGFQ